jgi:hypothetical protein
MGEQDLCEGGRREVGGEVTHTPAAYVWELCNQHCLILVYSTLPTVLATDRNDIVDRCYSHHLCFEVASSSLSVYI